MFQEKTVKLRCNDVEFAKIGPASAGSPQVRRAVAVAAGEKERGNSPPGCPGASSAPWTVLPPGHDIAPRPLRGAKTALDGGAPVKQRPLAFLIDSRGPRAEP